MKKSIKINKHQLSKIISESIKQALNEDYRIFFFDEIEDLESYNELEHIEPIYILGPNDYNEENDEIIVNGKPMFYASENTNYPFNDNKPREGDLVFETFGGVSLYRRGLNYPTGENFYEHSLIGTIPEIKNFLHKYRKEWIEDYGVDVAEIN